MVSKEFAKRYSQGWLAGNSPDLNPIENIWSITDETTLKDPAPKMKTKRADKVTTPCTEKCDSDSEFQPCFSWLPPGVKGRDYIVCDS